MVGTQKKKKLFSKYYCLQGVPEGERLKNTILMIKMIVFLLQFLKGNYWTAVQCAVRKSPLN